MIWYYSIQVCVQPSALVNAISNMLVLPVFLTRHSSIKVRRENDCKDKAQILKIKKKTILSNFNDNNQSVYQIPIYSCLLARIFNPQPFRSNICFYVICCFFVFFSAFFLNLRRKFKLYFSVQCSQFRFQTFQLFFSLYYLIIEKMYDLTFVIIEKVCNLLVFIIEKVYLCSRNI